MENFIKNIFDIDEEAEKYQKSLEKEKLQLMQDRKSKIEELDKEYINVLADEKSNLNSRLKNIETQDTKQLDDYKKKSEKIKDIFAQKKDLLVKSFAKSLLESGELNGQ